MSSLPALLGGAPVRPQGPPTWPGADPLVLEALQAAYHAGHWGKYHGDNCPRLEKALQEYHGVEHVLLCGSGTFAIELALRALHVGHGDEVLLAAYDYPGNFLSVHAVGAHPVLVDVRADNWQLSLERLAEAISTKTKAVIASHLHGGVIPMRELKALADSAGLAVIEDAAQCPGALIDGRRAGTWGDVGVLSFGGSKLLSAGRGGALLTPNEAIFQRARTAMLRGNLVCPLSELQAAVLLPQLAQLDQRNSRRRDRVAALLRLLEHVPGLTPFRNRAEPETQPGYYKLGFQFDAERFGLSRALFVKALRAEGIAFDEGFHSLHVGRSPRRYRAGTALGEADRAHAGSVVLHHPVLLGSQAEIEEVSAAVHKVWNHRATVGQAVRAQ